MLKVFAFLFLGTRDSVIAAPAVRVGLSWARLNLHRVSDIVTIGCVVVLVMFKILGQAQLV